MQLVGVEYKTRRSDESYKICNIATLPYALLVPRFEPAWTSGTRPAPTWSHSAAKDVCSDSVTVVVFAPIRGLMELGTRGIGRPESFCFVIIDSFTVPDRDKK
jgi:hypothetical protein